MSSREIECLKTQMLERTLLFRKLINRFGKEVLHLVADHTAEQIKHKLANASLHRRDLDMVMELLWNQMGEGFEFAVEDRSLQSLKIKVTRCIIADEMRRLDAADIGKAFYCAYDRGFCQGLNPLIRFCRTKTLMAGDDCCDHVYELIES